MKEVTDPVEIAQVIYDLGGKCSELRLNGYHVSCHASCPFYEKHTDECTTGPYKERLKTVSKYLRMALMDLI